jgi:pyruvate,water dikinase
MNVIDLKDAAQARCGSKAGRLGELLRAGFSVPDGFVVDTDAFDAHLAALGGEPTSERVRAAAMPEDVARSIRDAAEALGGASVAVRSSGIAEDRADASFAGQYETVLDVRGADAIVEAVKRCWASVFSDHVKAYRATLDDPGALSMAVLVQRLVPADAAGVAFSADPVTGDRDLVTVSAVSGLGERLVSGDVSGEEWSVNGTAARRRRRAEDVLDETRALAVADLAREVERHYGAPQDIEWAFEGEELRLLQARPMTALPEEIEWEAPGCFVRDFRLGEWIGGPVSPLGASWLVADLTNSTHKLFSEWCYGWNVPEPSHVFLNGWYFYSLESMNAPPIALLRHFVPMLFFRFRRFAGLFPPLAHLGLDWWLREWREETLPAYERAVRSAEARVDEVELRELPALVDELIHHAAAHFGSMVVVAGYSAKAELPLAAFWKKHVEPLVEESVLTVARGTSNHATPDPHAVQDLDWLHPTHGERDVDDDALAAHAAEARARVQRERDEVLARARAALSAGKRKKLDKLIATAHRAHALREEQSAVFTLAWPAMRRALARVGEAIRARGIIARAEDVHFLEKSELLAALDGDETPRADLVVERRDRWRHQRQLTPPLVIGELPKMLAAGLAAGLEDLRTTGAAERDGLHGMPASPGRVTGPARVIRDLSELDRLQEGEILVAPVTTPGWTPAFLKAAAVVTDTGSLASHASVVAREYGIPCVVGTTDATARFCDGELITVDGSAGVVES